MFLDKQGKSRTAAAAAAAAALLERNLILILRKFNYHSCGSAAVLYFLVQKFHGTHRLTTMFIQGQPVNHILS